VGTSKLGELLRSGRSKCIVLMKRVNRKML
jgi:hypothetical protein